MNSDPLYLITDTKLSGLTHTQIARQALKAGIRIIQLRDKDMPKRDIYKEAAAIKKMTQKFGAVLIINDHIDIALAVGADGVHVGQQDMPVKEARKLMGTKKIIGVSTHDIRQAVRAEKEGADYIGFGPMFHTDTKDAGKPKGLNELGRVKRRVAIPVIAIGGITRENVSAVLNSGADKCAVASGILSGDIAENTEKYMAAINASCPFLFSAGYY